MSSTTIIDFPAITNPASMDWSLKRFDARFTSPLSGFIQDIQRPGAQWQCQLAWHVLSYDDAQELQAWSAQMSQAGVRTAIPNFAYKMRGSAAGSPVISGVSQTGNSLTTSGWTDSSTNVLRAGDFFQVTNGTQHQLLQVTADVSSDSSGDATVNFTPSLRFSPSNSSALVTSNPTVYFAFSKPESAMSWSSPLIASFSIQLMEDISL